MTELNEREKELVAIGASIGSNCIPCIAFHVGKAQEAGLTQDEIEAAVTLSEEIRSVPASLVVNTARSYLDTDTVAQTDTDSGICGCGDPISEPPAEDSDSGSAAVEG